MNRPTPERQIYRTPGRIVVLALVCLYAGPACGLVGAILEANDTNGEPLFVLGKLFWAIWFPLILLAIVVQLVGPTPSDHFDRPASPEKLER